MHALKNKKQTKEHIEKRKHTFFKKGHSVSRKLRDKLSLLNKTLIGEKAKNWKGGWENKLSHCLDCGEKLKSYYAEKCNKCYGISRRGKNHHYYNYKFSEVEKKKISIATKKAIRRPEIWEKIPRKEKHHNWRKGLSRQPYPIEWRETLKEEIRKRDNYICQKCGCSQLENIHKLSIHHVDYNKNNLSEVNLISLCKRCNAEVNFNRKYWEEYFTKLLLSRVFLVK